MQNNTETKVWNATLYLRLSRDDGDKEESNSITGQRELLRDFIRTRPELREYAVRIDDGFTGSNFERPSFKKMLEDVKAGRTNCIIVKDLSRFGRNYLDAGEYIEKIFPFLGVRFIAVNDNYDSLGGKNASDELIIPFKNLINEAYCRDISVKVRTQLEVKRKSGQYIGAFAVYGYLKDEANKNHLIVDEYAADIVRDIFSWKLEGMSPQDIASRLNHNGVLSPMEYKKSLGMKFATSFKANPQAVWSANAVLRILKNPVYTGICQTHTNDITSCPKKNIREDVLIPMLLQAIRTQITLAADMEALIRRVNSSPKYRKQTATLQGKLDAAKKSLMRYNGLYDSLYQNYVDKLMTEQEYITLKRRYKAEAEEAERLIEALTCQQAAEAAHTPENPFLTAFGSFRDADTLTREMVQALIQRVYVDGGSNIEIVFRYRDEYKELCTYLEGRQADA